MAFFSWRCYGPLMAIFLAFFIYNLLLVFRTYDGKVDDYSHCKKLHYDGFLGPEDFVVMNNQIIITGSDDRMSLWEISTPPNAPQGRLFIIHPKLEKIRPLELKNFPKDIWFHPHGIYLYESPTKLERFLYVINHAYDHGEERIEVFKVIGESFDEISIEYYQSIAPEIFSEFRGILNDLVVIEPGKFYVSRYRAFPDCLDGRDKQSNQLICNIYSYLNTLTLLLRIPYTSVWYGSYDPNKTGKVTEVEFFQVSDKEITVNGIYYLPNENKLLVANPMERTFLVYSINDTNHQLKKIDTIDSIIGIDNFAMNPKTGTIYGGGLNVVEYFNYITEIHSTKEWSKVKSISGGVIEITPNIQKSSYHEYTVKIPLYLPGSFYSGVSIVTEVDDLYVLGSWYDYGVVICKMNN